MWGFVQETSHAVSQLLRRKVVRFYSDRGRTWPWRWEAFVSIPVGEALRHSPPGERPARQEGLGIRKVHLYVLAPASARRVVESDNKAGADNPPCRRSRRAL